MPLLKTISENELSMGLWALTEPTAILESGLLLSEEENELYQSFRHEKRQREFLAIRQLLHFLTGGDYQLRYHKNGKPFLNNVPGYVSISHSKNMVAVILSDHPAGIDVEEICRNTERIDTRFLTERELEWTSRSTDYRLSRLLCWCAKEAVYKMSDENLADFSRQIEILPFDVFKDTSTEAIIRTERGIRSVFPAFGRFADNALAWCIDKDGR
jgi:4'-phosphopantetheinyl transferase